jgi:hypothetical protein
MPETLYAILTNGNILPITDVTALAIDSTLTIKPGDFYRNDYVEQTIEQSDTPEYHVVTNQEGDTKLAAALETESWLCSFWKFTRGASLPILYLAWRDVEAICDQYPNRVYSGVNTGVLYLPLRSGNIAVITGVAASTTAVTINSSLAIFPGDYYRNNYIEQELGEHNDGGVTITDLVVTSQFGDSKDGDPLNPETWDASHYAFTRTGLITLYTPWSRVVGGPSTNYPNRVAA